MFKPAPKSKGVAEVLDDLFNRTESITTSQCTNTRCDEPNLKFKNDTSQREYTLSGLCQDCQNDVFGENE